MMLSVFAKTKGISSNLDLVLNNELKDIIFKTMFYCLFKQVKM